MTEELKKKWHEQEIIWSSNYSREDIDMKKDYNLHAQWLKDKGFAPSNIKIDDLVEKIRKNDKKNDEGDLK